MVTEVGAVGDLFSPSNPENLSRRRVEGRIAHREELPRRTIRGARRNEDEEIRSVREHHAFDRIPVAVRTALLLVAGAVAHVPHGAIDDAPGAAIAAEVLSLTDELILCFLHEANVIRGHPVREDAVSAH